MRKLISSITSLYIYSVLSLTTFAAPAVSLIRTNSCSLSSASTLKDVIMGFVIGCVLTNTVYIVIGVSFIIFIWGVFKFVVSEGDDKQSGREFMFWGVIGLFVMISIWGLVAILQQTFNLSGNYSVTPRQVNINF